jgi:hypothetical protein
LTAFARESTSGIHENEGASNHEKEGAAMKKKQKATIQQDKNKGTTSNRHPIYGYHRTRA